MRIQHPSIKRLSHIHFIILSFINTHTFSLVITFLKLPLPTRGTMIVELQDRIPLHMLPYPTLTVLILWQVPMGMHIPNPTPMIITFRSTTEDQDSQVTRKITHTYLCVAHHHKDHNTRTRWEHNAKKYHPTKNNFEGWILHESQNQ